MNARDSLAAIVQRLQEIKEILADYGAAARSQQENNRTNPQRVRAEITFDDASKREAQDEAKRQNSTQEKIGRYAFYAFLPAIIPSSVQLPLRFPCKLQIRQGATFGTQAAYVIYGTVTGELAERTSSVTSSLSPR